MRWSHAIHGGEALREDPRGPGCEKLSAADIAPIPSSSYPTPARRPANSRLDCSAFEQAFAVHRPHWRAQLAAHFASRG